MSATQLPTIALLHNAALLIALILVYHLIQDWLHILDNATRKLLSGLLIGSMTTLLMLTPLDYGNGIVFDTSPVLLSFSGLFFGPLPTGIAMILASIGRMLLGGTGLWAGLASILVSGSIGIAWGQFRKTPPRTLELLLLGLVASLVMFMILSTFPSNAPLMDIFWPILAIYPASTVLLGLLHQYLREHMEIRHRLQAATARIDYAEALHRKLLIDSSRDGIVILRDDGSVFEVNRTFAGMLGYSRDELSTLRAWDWEFLWEKEKLLELLTSVGPEGDHFETQHRHKDGSVIDVEISTNAETIDGEKLIFCVCRDVSERKKTQEALSLGNMVYQNSREAMMVMDRNSNIMDVNPRFTAVTGYHKDEVIGANSSILHSSRHPISFYRSIWEEAKKSGHWEGEVWNRRKNGEEYPEWLSITPVYNNAGEVYRWIAQFTDISEIKNAEQLIWQQANFDSLTGLPNRRMFNDRLAQEIKKSSRHEDKLALLFLDLDHFKEINDNLGHEMGDQLLQQASERLKGCIRQSDTVARLGGDEFVIILTELRDSDHVGVVAQKILWAMARPFSLSTDVVYVSTSIGVTLYPDDAERPTDMLKKADQAMYAAKRQGRNQYQYFTPAMQEAVSRRMQVANELRQAIAQNQFQLLYQPIVDLRDGWINKTEALLRWQHPVHGLRSPAEFVTIAEDTGLINEIGDWVFEQITDQIIAWRKINPDIQISINKSPVQFRNNAGKAWLDILAQKSLPGDNLIVEITEGLLLDAGSAIRDQLLAYRDAGVSVALDDFGTGYSSLAYLKAFDIDYLKIDKSFINNLAPDSEDLTLSRAIITMAHRLGIAVIAEGVETEDQRQLLEWGECDFAQGYLFSAPVSANELQQFLLNSQSPHQS